MQESNSRLNLSKSVDLEEKDNSEEIFRLLRRFEDNLDQAKRIDNKFHFISGAERVFNFIQNKRDLSELKLREKEIFGSEELIQNAINNPKTKWLALDSLQSLFLYSTPIHGEYIYSFLDKERKEKYYALFKKIFLKNIDSISDSMLDSNTNFSNKAISSFNAFLKSEAFIANDYYRQYLENNAEFDEDKFRQEYDIEDLMKAKEAFLAKQPQIEENIAQTLEFLNGNEIYSYSQDQYFYTCAERKLFTEKGKALAGEIFSKSRHGFLSRLLADDILNNKEQILKRESLDLKLHTIAENALLDMGFSVDEVKKLVESWLITNFTTDTEKLENVKEDQRDFIKYNLEYIKYIEDKRPGAAKYLLYNFGITCFARYEEDELIKQYDQREDTSPYGIFLSATQDWNGAFNDRSKHSELIRNQVEDNGFLMRAIEVNGKIDLAKKLLSLNKKYNQKIKFIYVSAHGNVNILAFGEKGAPNDDLRQNDLKGEGVKRVGEMLSDDAVIVLASCLTGVSKGIAEEIAKTYNAKVIASDQETAGIPYYVQIKKNNSSDNLDFDIKFRTYGLKEGKKGTVVYKPNSSE